MPKKIKTWEELEGLESDDYKIEVKLLGKTCGWAHIVPKVETEETKTNYYGHHVFLSTYTFYPSYCNAASEVLQKYGFNVELVEHK